MKPRKLRLLPVAMTLAALPIACNAQPNTAPPDIRLPDGFSIEVFADNVPNARSLALGSEGTVFVSTRSDGRVFAIRSDETGAREVIALAEDLRTPNGIDYHNGDLYVAETERLLRFPAIESNLQESAPFEVVDESFPGERHHGWRYIKIGPDEQLYMSIGAPCNVCDREGFGEIQRMNLDGTDKETFAFGVRNSVGLTFHPSTGELWFTDNGRDMLGDDTPPGELNIAGTSGLHFGFPFCHGGDVSDPEFGEQRSCAEFEAPAQQLGPHVAPLGLAIYDGQMFPDDYRGSVFIAEHGSWNRSKRIGYRISRVTIANGRANGYEVFAEGWLQDEEVSGRPVDVLELEDGSLLVSDDHAGRLYRISYTLPLLEATARGTRLGR